MQNQQNQARNIQTVTTQAHFIPHAQNIQQNSLRHTIGTVQTTNQQQLTRQQSGNQVGNIRNTLPANRSPQQYVQVPPQQQILNPQQYP